MKWTDFFNNISQMGLSPDDLWGIVVEKFWFKLGLIKGNKVIDTKEYKGLTEKRPTAKLSVRGKRGKK